jgi:hypothetical protein
MAWLWPYNGRNMSPTPINNKNWCFRRTSYFNFCYAWNGVRFSPVCPLYYLLRKVEIPSLLQVEILRSDKTEIPQDTIEHSYAVESQKILMLNYERNVKINW